MAPSSGIQLIPKAIKFFKTAFARTSSILQIHLPIHPPATLTPIRIPIRSNHLRRGTSPVESVRQYSTLRHASSSAAILPVSRTSARLARTHRTPFATSLRPNLATGTMSRTSTGAARARLFSHAAVTNASVAPNVSAAMRAFLLNGGVVRYDGVDAAGRSRWMTAVQEKKACESKVRSGLDLLRSNAFSAGSIHDASTFSHETVVEWSLTPLVTSIPRNTWTGPTTDDDPAATATLSSTRISIGLAADFARAVQHLATVLADLERLRVLGDLPVRMAPNGSAIWVVFAGRELEDVAHICDDLGVRRGVVKDVGSKTRGEEIEWWRMMDAQKVEGLEKVTTVWNASASDESGVLVEDDGPVVEWRDWKELEAESEGTSRYEGFEGICRFLEQCGTEARR